VYQHLSPAWPLAFIEDHPRNAEEIRQAGMNVILFRTPRNDHVFHIGERLKMANGWGEVIECVEAFEAESKSK
jgi:beta-phosphoglucomutase-like phosphatase (HAD superfamily)